MKSTNRLKNLRTYYQYSQRDVADWFGLTSPQFVSNIERGLCAYPANWIPTLARKFKQKQSLFIDDLLRYERAKIMREVKR